MAIAALTLLTACQAPLPQRGIEATRIARLITDDGTSTVMGSARVPASLASEGPSAGPAVTLAGASLRLLDAEGTPLSGILPIETDAMGTFTLPNAPLGRSVLAELSGELDGRRITLRKYLRPTQSLTCAHVDMATTLVADKLTCDQPLVTPDPGLEGAELFELVDPAKLIAVESRVRELLKSEALEQGSWLQALADGETAPLFDMLVQRYPDLGALYQGSFERPDSSLGIRITAVGSNRATIPGADERVVMGVLNLKAEGLPPETVKVEYVLNGKKVAESAAPPTWEAVLDTWDHPNGPYTLSTVAVGPDGRREAAIRTYMLVRNALDLHCPLP
jgi:hypothetical protein